MLIYADRSRIEVDQRCPRLRAYTYEWEGQGLDLDGPDGTTGRDIGSCVHEGIAAALTGAALGDAIAAAHAAPEFARLAADADIDTVDALVMTWWAVVRPILMGDTGWTVVDVEREESVDIPQGADTVRFLSRLDLLARSAGDVWLNNRQVPPGLWIWDWKCVKSGGARWRVEQDYQMQWMSSLLGPEARLGERIEGVVVCALLKENHPLVACWRNRETGETRTRYEYTCTESHPFRYAKGGVCMGGTKHRLGKEWEAVPVRTLPGGQAAYFDRILREDPELLRDWVDWAGPMRRASDYALARWQRQSFTREVEIAAATAQAGGEPFDEATLDTVFPMRTANGNCTQFSRVNADGTLSNGCPAMRFCWGSAVPEEFPLRQPNHPAEAARWASTPDKSMGVSPASITTD